MHTFRATGIAAYLDAGGTLETVQAMAAHESPCTTTLYDRTGDETTFDEIERISISTGLNVPEAPAIDRDSGRATPGHAPPMTTRSTLWARKTTMDQQLLCSQPEFGTPGALLEKCAAAALPGQ